MVAADVPRFRTEYLRELRTAAKMSMGDLAREFHELPGCEKCSDRMVYKWEAGLAWPGSLYLFALSRVFRVKPGEFFDGWPRATTK